MGGNLGYDVSDPGAHRGLGASKVFEFGFGAPGRGELEHEANGIAPDIRWGLVPRRDVRCRRGVERVDAAEQLQVEASELVALIRSGASEVGDMPEWQHVYL